MMHDDTSIGGPQHRFPVTHRSAVLATRSSDPAERARALEVLAAAYWKPAYKYIRMKWKESNEDAKDLTQGFFAKAIEKGYFQNYDSGKASFRTYIRVCLDGYVANERKAARRQKRSAGPPPLPFDFEDAEREIGLAMVPAGVAMEDYFYQEWVRHLFSQGIESLRLELEGSGKSVHFEIFKLYDLEPSESGGKLTYNQIAERFGLTPSNVTNYLALARREFRRLLLERLRELTGDEREFRQEARFLLGRDV